MRAYLYAQKAAAAFPLNRYIRQWRAIAGAGMSGIHPDLVIEDALRSLRHDPHDGNILSVIFIQALRKGDLTMAQLYLEKIEAIAADWPEMIQFQRLLDEVRALEGG